MRPHVCSARAIASWGHLYEGGGVCWNVVEEVYRVVMFRSYAGG